VGREVHRRHDRAALSEAGEPLRLSAGAALLDIEGTLGSIAFVRDVLFPYARARIDAFVRAHCEDPEVRAILDATAREAGEDVHDLDAIVGTLLQWSDRDVKVTPLKELQGMIWKDGFESGAIRAHLYDDAVDALRRFHDAGIRLFIYSSGSIAAQKLLFGHAVAGDLRSLFEGYFDTTIGSKREPASYRRIAEAIGSAPQGIVFFSDHALELDAARAAELQTVQLARPEDGVRAEGTHPSTGTFAGIELQTVKV
jgi:enolase-phosphatase E1